MIMLERYREIVKEVCSLHIRGEFIDFSILTNKYRELMTIFNKEYFNKILEIDIFCVGSISNGWLYWNYVFRYK